jgi:hypothetical protein
MIPFAELTQPVNSDPSVAASLFARVCVRFLILLLFLLLLVGVEVVTRLTMTPVSSLDLFVTTPQQRMQVSDPKQSGIFEGDPLLLWRLKPNLNNAVWDFTVLFDKRRTLSRQLSSRCKAAGTYRIICLGDSGDVWLSVPVVWPDKPTEYDTEWLPFPMLLEKHLANRQTQSSNRGVSNGSTWLHNSSGTRVATSGHRLCNLTWSSQALAGMTFSSATLLNRDSDPH